MNRVEKYGRVALVAGASEGLGAAFARRLAHLGFDLVLIARRSEPLMRLADEIRKTYGVNIKLISCDLAGSNALDQIKENIAEMEINVMVYNAVSPYIGAYLDCREERQTEMTHVNLITPQKLVYYFGGKMVNQQKGAIILMSSLAGFQGSGFLVAYAAAKAFTRVLAEGLWFEWRGKGVDVIACCAGATSTPNYVNSKPGSLGFFNPPVQTPEQVVQECFEKLGHTPSFISGRGNKLASFIMNRLLSRKRAVVIMGEATRKMYNIQGH